MVCFLIENGYGCTLPDFITGSHIFFSVFVILDDVMCLLLVKNVSRYPHIDAGRQKVSTVTPDFFNGFQTLNMSSKLY